MIYIIAQTNICKKYEWKLKVHLDGTLRKTKKPSHFCEGFLFLLPLLGSNQGPSD